MPSAACSSYLTFSIVKSLDLYYTWITGDQYALFPELRANDNNNSSNTDAVLGSEISCSRDYGNGVCSGQEMSWAEVGLN